MNGTVLPGGPVNKNCTVSLKVLPNAIELGLLYHAAKAGVRGTVTSKVGGCVFVGNTKWNCALVMSRGVERPIMEMLNPLRVIAQGVTLEITGTVGFTVIVLVTGVSGLPAESVALVVMVMIPATVPMITGTLAVGAAGVRVKVVVVPEPLANLAS